MPRELLAHASLNPRYTFDFGTTLPTRPCAYADLRKIHLLGASAHGVAPSLDRALRRRGMLAR